MSWNGKPTAPPLGAVRGGNGRAGAARSEARTRALEWPLTGEAGRWGRAQRNGLEWRAAGGTPTGPQSARLNPPRRRCHQDRGTASTFSGNGNVLSQSNSTGSPPLVRTKPWAFNASMATLDVA